MNEEQDNLDLHFVVVKRRKDLFQLVNEYVEVICELKDKNNKKTFKDQLEEYIQLLSEEIYEMVHEDVMLDTLMRCGEALNKKEYYE
jgi:hypothetical protein